MQVVNPPTDRLLDLKPGECVLHIACGNGAFAHRLAKLGVEVVAFDFSECFRAGFMLDGLEEPAVSDGPNPQRPFSRGNRPGIPPALVARMRLVIDRPREGEV